jgi:hypothetical protein
MRMVRTSYQRSRKGANAQSTPDIELPKKKGPLRSLSILSILSSVRSNSSRGSGRLPLKRKEPREDGRVPVGKTSRARNSEAVIALLYIYYIKSL